MHRILIPVMLAAALCGCHGAESAPRLDLNRPSAFSGLPSPVDLLNLDQGRSGSKQVSFTTEFEGHQWDPALPHSDNLTPQPDYHRTLMAGRKAPLTYCIYTVAPSIIPAGAALNSLTAHCFYGETVAGFDGMYIGVADFAANSWRWLGPLHGVNWTYDLTGLGFAGNDGSEYFVAVNYSEVEGILIELSFDYEGELPGTSWVYYTQAPVSPGVPRGIARVPVSGATAPETLRSGIMATGFRSPQVRYQPAGDRLYYTKEEFGNGGIYWCEMDGTGENDHRTHAPSMQLLDWDLSGNIEFFIDGYGTETPTGWWYNWATAAGVSATPANGYISAACFNSFQETHDFAVYLGLSQPLPATNSGLYWAATDTVPFTGDAEARADNGVEHVKSLAYGRYRYANGEYREGCYFVSDARNPYTPGDTSENIYFSRVADGLIRTYLVTPDYDFGGITFSPDGRWAAIAVKEPADPYYDIRVVPATAQYDWADYPPIASGDCWGDLEWYYDALP